MDRSVEMRLRLNLQQWNNQTRRAAGDLDGLIARAALLDAELDRVDATSTRAATSLRQTRNEVRGVGRNAERATPQIQAARTQLDMLNASSASSSRNLTGLSRTSEQTGRRLDGTGRSVDRFSGRLGLAIDAVLTMGSGLVPIGALAGQAAAGLAAMAASSAVLAASGVIAFQGIGDAVKAVQKYQDDPSQKNLEAARKDLEKMAPAAQQFVVEFQKSRPIFSDIQDAAARGWFPGLTMALDQLDDVAPKIEKILVKTGRMGGLLANDAVKSLGSDRWDDFLEFVADEVPSASASLARIMGDLAHGAAEMWMAFDPGNDDFIAWVEDVADSFDRWASSAEGRDDIEAFLDYARQNGPDVAEFLSAIGGSLTGIVKAAAPLGGPTLDALTAVAEVIEAFANSDLATPLLAGLGALRLYTRAAAVATSVQGRLNTQMAATSQIAAGPRTTVGRYNAAAGVAQSVNTVNPWSYSGTRGAPNYGANLQAALLAPRQQDVRAAEQARRLAMLGTGAQAGAGLGLLALTASGVTDDMNAANTASMALMGTMIAPGWGTAAGAIAGFFTDMAGANDDFTASIDATKQSLGSGDFGGLTGMLAKARAERDKLKADSQELKFFSLSDPTDAAQGGVELIKSVFGKSQAQSAARDYAAVDEQVRQTSEAVATLGEAFGHTMGPIDGSTRSTNELMKALESAKPAMDRLGVSQDDLIEAQRQQAAISADSGWGKVAEAALGTATPLDDMTKRLARVDKWMDSAAGRAQDYRLALRDLATDQGTAAEQADRYRETFDALVSPANDAEAALSAQVESLKAIRDLKNTDAGFSQRSEDGRTNLATTRDYTAAVRERIATMIAAKRSDEDITATLKESRRQFIESGVAAGFDAEQMAKRATAIGLTPKLIQTTFEALNISTFDQTVRGLRNQLDGLPSTVVTALRTGGVPQTVAEVDALVAKYKLTEEDRQALISIVGTARQDAFALDAALDNAARDRSSTITVTTVQRITRLGSKGVGPLRADASGNPGAADGGTVPKTGLPYADRHLYLLADGERIVSNRYGQVDRNRRLLDGVNSNLPPHKLRGLVGLADGGTTGRGPGPSSIFDLGPVDRYRDARAGDMASKSLLKLADAAEKAAQGALDEARDRVAAARTLREQAGSSLSVATLTGNGLAGFNAGVSANLNDTRSGDYQLRKLRSKGLGGKNDTGGLFEFLSQSGDLQLLQQFGALTPSQIRAQEKKYASLQRAEVRFGDQAVLEKYGKSVGALDQTVKDLSRELRGLKRDISADVREGARKGTKEGQQEADRGVSSRARTGSG